MKDATGKPLSEKAWQNIVIEFARFNGWRVFHFRPAMNRRGQWETPGLDPGFPDLVLVRNRVIFAELKRDGGEMTPEQRAVLTQLREAHPHTYLWHPSDWEKVQNILSKSSTF